MFEDNADVTPRISDENNLKLNGIVNNKNCQFCTS